MGNRDGKKDGYTWAKALFVHHWHISAWIGTWVGHLGHAAPLHSKFLRYIPKQFPNDIILTFPLGLRVARTASSHIVVVILARVLFCSEECSRKVERERERESTHTCVVFYWSRTFAPILSYHIASLRPSVGEISGRTR